MASSDIVVIDGRECKGTALKNKDVLYFPVKYKGKEYRKVLEITSKSFHQTDSGDVKADIADYVLRSSNVFPIICKKVQLVDGKQIDPTIEYLDDLDVDVYQEVMGIVYNATAEIMGRTAKKK